MRPHQSLASMGVAALLRFLESAGEKMDPETWKAALVILETAASDTRPGVRDLITPPERFRRRLPSSEQPGEPSTPLFISHAENFAACFSSTMSNPLHLVDAVYV